MKTERTDSSSLAPSLMRRQDFHSTSDDDFTLPHLHVQYNEMSAFIAGRAYAFDYNV